ncbi:MAG: DUF4270 domain-containing protein [Rhodothermia bacterium]|nr:DUF4270 domain-containing protein [Rhodothermia bacterium]
MKSSRLVTLLLSAGFLALGCDDPSPLSADLVDTSSGAPETVIFALGALPTTFAADITGNARRSLVGQVDDPVAGRISAAAAMDFASPVALSDDFEAGPVTVAELRLQRSYQYGDTTSTVQVAVRSIDEDWDASGSTSSDEVPSGSVVTTGAIVGSDTLLTIPLPDAWIEENSSLLRSTDFVSEFKGFYIDAVGGNAVLGFSSQGSSFRVVSGEDTVDFVVSRNLTLIDQEEPGTAPAGTVVLQDGIGNGLTLDFSQAVDSLASTALNRVAVRLPIDSTSATLPANFVRPRPTQVDLAGVTSDSVVVTIAVSVQDESGLRFESASLNAVVQAMLLGETPFDKYVLTGHLDIAPVDNTIDALIIPDGSLGRPSPKLDFTVVIP